MNQVIRTPIAALGALIFVLSLPSHADAIKVRPAQNLGPISGVALIAKQKGFFDKHGLDVAVNSSTSGGWSDWRSPTFFQTEATNR